MSTSQPSASPSNVYECEECGGPRTQAASIKGSFCSQDCYHSHQASKQARDILNQLERDHRYCYTCFRRLKDTYRPPSRWGLPDSVTSFQSLTPHAQIGQKTKHRPHYLNTDHIKTTVDQTRTGAICSCGNTHHRDLEPVIRQRCLLESAHYLLTSIQSLKEEGKFETVRVDASMLFDALTPVQDGVSLEEALTEAVEVTRG